MSEKSKDDESVFVKWRGDKALHRHGDTIVNTVDGEEVIGPMIALLREMALDKTEIRIGSHCTDKKIDDISRQGEEFKLNPYTCCKDHEMIVVVGEGEKLILRDDKESGSLSEFVSRRHTHASVEPSGFSTRFEGLKNVVLTSLEKKYGDSDFSFGEDFFLSFEFPMKELPKFSLWGDEYRVLFRQKLRGAVMAFLNERVRRYPIAFQSMEIDKDQFRFVVCREGLKPPRIFLGETESR